MPLHFQSAQLVDIDPNLFYGICFAKRIGCNNLRPYFDTLSQGAVSGCGVRLCLPVVDFKFQIRI